MRSASARISRGRSAVITSSLSITDRGQRCSAQLTGRLPTDASAPILRDRRQLVPLAEQASLCHFLTTGPRARIRGCGGCPNESKESSSPLGSGVWSRGRLGRHTEVFGVTAEDLGAHGMHQPTRSTLAARWLASAPLDRHAPPRPGWRAPGLLRTWSTIPSVGPRPGRKRLRSGSPTAVSAWSGMTNRMVRDDHDIRRAHDSQGDRKHDRSAAGHLRRRSIGPGPRPAEAIAAEVETGCG